MSRPQTASLRKHILLCYSEEDESSLKAVNKLRNEFRNNRLRVYNPKDGNDVNTMIANGVENSQIIICFPSKLMQSSKVSSKIMNYADQTKTSLINIKNSDGFEPTDWLGAILAPAPSCQANFTEIIKLFASMKVDTKSFLLERDEKADSFNDIPTTDLFWGGSKSGNITAVYYYLDVEYNMELEVKILNCMKKIIRFFIPCPHRISLHATVFNKFFLYVTVKLTVPVTLRRRIRRIIYKSAM
jgi:hypothetical protein